MLSTLTLDCPKLESLDATFCYRLGNNALSWIPQCRPPLQRLFLGLCTQIDAQALHVLSSLGSLSSLDLSYTEIKVLTLTPNGSSLIHCILWCSLNLLTLKSTPLSCCRGHRVPCNQLCLCSL